MDRIAGQAEARNRGRPNFAPLGNEIGACAGLADEYDAAQDRGEVQTPGGDRKIIVPAGNNDRATVSDLGLTRKAIHEARQLRDAEVSDPGAIWRALYARLAQPWP